MTADRNLQNFHTHTIRCGHASGSEREYIEAAIQSGFELLGFSDHTYYPYNNGYVSGIRMSTAKQLQDYVETLEHLREEYRDRIDIRIGLEVEYYPKHFEELIRITKQLPIEFMLLAQHYSDNEYDGIYFGSPTEREEDLEQYVLQLEEGMRRIREMKEERFLYLAHPDLIHYTGDRRIYEKWMRRLIDSAMMLDFPLEINLQGTRTGRHYPAEDFWKWAGEAGAETVIGLDAHAPEAVTVQGAYEEALALASRYDLKLIRLTDKRRKA